MLEVGPELPIVPGKPHYMASAHGRLDVSCVNEDSSPRAA